MANYNYNDPFFEAPEEYSKALDLTFKGRALGESIDGLSTQVQNLEDFLFLCSTRIEAYFSILRELGFVPPLEDTKLYSQLSLASESRDYSALDQKIRLLSDLCYLYNESLNAGLSFLHKLQQDQQEVKLSDFLDLQEEVAELKKRHQQDLEDLEIKLSAKFEKLLKEKEIVPKPEEIVIAPITASVAVPDVEEEELDFYLEPQAWSFTDLLEGLLELQEAQSHESNEFNLKLTPFTLKYLSQEICKKPLGDKKLKSFLSNSSDLLSHHDWDADPYLQSIDSSEGLYLKYLLGSQDLELNRLLLSREGQVSLSSDLAFPEFLDLIFANAATFRKALEIREASFLGFNNCGYARFLSSSSRLGATRNLYLCDYGAAYLKKESDRFLSLLASQAEVLSQVVEMLFGKDLLDCSNYKESALALFKDKKRRWLI